MLVRNKVLVVDTSILCCWLGIPGKETCGSTTDRWDRQRVEETITAETQIGATIVLPLATIIETGNHIAQAASSRFELAHTLAEVIRLAADRTTPWAAFSDQDSLWTSEELKRLADDWPVKAVQQLSLGDATIVSVAEYYSRGGFVVEILTGDAGLKAYQPARPIPVPRRRK